MNDIVREAPYINGVEIKCVNCEKWVGLRVHPLRLMNWLKMPKKKRPLVQGYFTELNEDEREMLLSRLCPVCWENLFLYSEDEDEVGPVDKVSSM